MFKTSCTTVTSWINGEWVMSNSNRDVQDLGRELRSSMGDREKLSRLHSIVTERVNLAYGEEREELLKIRQEVKNALNCRVPGGW